MEGEGSLSVQGDKHSGKTSRWARQAECVAYTYPDSWHAQGRATKALGGDRWPLFLFTLQQAQRSRVMTPGSDSL